MRTKGFTIVEIITVITVLSLIIIIAVPIYNSITKTVKDKSYDNKVKTIELAAEKYLYDSHIENNTQFTASKLIIDNYYTAEKYVNDMPWIDNPVDPNDNLACHIIEATIENFEYNVKFTKNSDCELSKNEVDVNQVTIDAYKLIKNGAGQLVVGDKINVNNGVIDWVNTDVLVVLKTSNAELKQYKEISYSFLGDSVIKNKESKSELTNVVKGNTINPENYVNVYKIEAAYILNQQLFITLKTDTGILSP